MRKRSKAEAIKRLQRSIKKFGDVDHSKRDQIKILQHKA